MLSSVSGLAPRVLGPFRQILKNGVPNLSSGQRQVRPFTAKHLYTTQQASAPSNVERKRFIPQAANVKHVKQEPVTPHVIPFSNPSTPFSQVKTASSAPEPALQKAGKQTAVIQATTKQKRLSNDPFRLQRFIDAQNSGYRHCSQHSQALEEMRRGRKQSHWSWYELPVVHGVGQSSMSHYFALNSLEEVRSYFANKTLKSRLLKIFRCINKHQSTPIQEIMGSRVNAAKLQSCATLFYLVTGNKIFLKTINQFYGGVHCKAAMNRYAEWSQHHLPVKSVSPAPVRRSPGAVKPPSPPAAPRPVQSIVANRNPAARNNYLVDEPIPEWVIKASIKTFQQEQRKRAAIAQHLQLQQAIAASRKTLRLEQVARQRSTIKQMLAGYDRRLRLKDVTRDGNCFFHALAANYSKRVTAAVMRKEIAQEACRYMRQYRRGKQLNPGYDYDLYQRLVVERGLSKMLQNGEYGYMTDIIFAARRLKRPVMVINRHGQECFTVDGQGKVLRSLNTLADASRLPRNTIIMIWDRTKVNNPGSDHFMLVKRKSGSGLSGRENPERQGQQCTE